MTEEPGKPATLGKKARAVLLSLIGASERSDQQASRVRFSAEQLVIASLVGAVILVLVIVIMTAMTSRLG